VGLVPKYIICFQFICYLYRYFVFIEELKCKQTKQNNGQMAKDDFKDGNLSQNVETLANLTSP
jgi:hypothetical protein